MPVPDGHLRVFGRENALDNDGQVGKVAELLDGFPRWGRKGPRGKAAGPPGLIAFFVDQIALRVAGDAGIAPRADELVVDAALAMRDMHDIDRERDGAGAGIFDALDEVEHRVLGAELAAARELPPILRPLAGRDDFIDAAVGDHERVGIARGFGDLVLAVRVEAVFSTGGVDENRMPERFSEQSGFDADLVDVGQEPRPNDDAAEGFTGIAQRGLITSAFGHVVPGDGVELFLGELGEVEDVGGFENRVSGRRSLRLQKLPLQEW